MCIGCRNTILIQKYETFQFERVTQKYVNISIDISVSGSLYVDIDIDIGISCFVFGCFVGRLITSPHPKSS